MQAQELNLRDYWQIIRKRRFLFAVIFLSVFVLTVIYTNLETPVYRAFSTVQWSERKTVGGLVGEFINVRAGDPLVAQTRIITSLPILESVVTKLELVPKNSKEFAVSEAARALQGKVHTDIVPDTNIIRILVTHEDPDAAAVLANKIAEVYIEENLKRKSEQSRSVREFVEKQLNDTTKRLKDSENILARFQEQESPTGMGITLQNLLLDLEVQRKTLLEKYTENHPDVIGIDAKISEVKNNLKKLPQKELEYNRLLREVEINNKIYRDLKNKLEAARIDEAEKISDVSLVDYAVSPAKPIKPNKQLNYVLGMAIGMMLGFVSIFILEQMDTSIGTIDEVENYLKLPTLGIIPYLKSPNEKKKSWLERILFKRSTKVDVWRQARERLLFNYANTSTVFEAYRILRTNIRTEIFQEKAKGNVFLFTSSGPEEGKSLTISNLAIVMAQGGLRTLLIDADMRRSTIHHIYGLKSKEPGLADILRGTAKFQEVIRTFADILMGSIGFDDIIRIPNLDNLNILTSGAYPMTPAELLATRDMDNLLKELREEYDLILIDSPPVLAVADAAILAPKVDMVVLIYRVGTTLRSVLLRTKNHLLEAGAKLGGVILNNISPEMEMTYGYQDYYKYYGKYYLTDEKGNT